jgi:Zn-dependent protease with chaperone function
MRSLLKPLLLVLAIPILSTALSMLAQRGWDSRWQAQLVRQLAAQHMRPDSRLLAKYSLGTLCGDSRSAARLPPCLTHNWHRFVIRLSSGVGAAGCLFLGALLLARHVSRGSRRRFERLFRAALVFAVSGTALLGIANALLAVLTVVAATLYLFASPIERVPLEIVLLVGTVAAVWALGMAAAAFSVHRRPTVTLVGRRLDPGTQPALVDDVRRAAEAAGATPPEHIVACLAPSLFVTEVTVVCLDGATGGRTLCLPLPLCRILSAAEFRALLVHELAHFSKDQEGYARHVAPFRTGMLQSLDALNRQRGIRIAAVAPARELLTVFANELGGTDEPGAERELEADRVAAGACGGEALAAALVKSQAFSPAWYTVAGAMFDAVATGTRYVNSSRLFEEVVASNTSRERLLGIGQQRHEHPTDRHPPLAERLTALDVDLAQVADAALLTRPAQPAIALVEGHEAIEEGLSASEHQFIAATGVDVAGLTTA